MLWVACDMPCVCVLVHCPDKLYVVRSNFCIGDVFVDAICMGLRISMVAAVIAMEIAIVIPIGPSAIVVLVLIAVIVLLVFG